MSSRVLFWGLLTASAVWSSDAANSTCFYPNGDAYKGSACFPNESISSCCGPSFICLSNGLCRPGPDTKKSYTYPYYRSGCTDSSWASPLCPQFCTGVDRDSGHGLQSCGNNKYCCKANLDCCDDTSKVFSLDVPTAVTTIPPLGQTTSTSTTLPHTTGSSGITKTAAIGIGVGVGVGGTFVLGLAVFLFLRRRRCNQKAENGDLITKTPTELNAFQNSIWNEVPGASPRDEKGYRIASGTGAVELESENKAHIPKEPQEVDHNPVYELGGSPGNYVDGRDEAH